MCNVGQYLKDEMTTCRMVARAAHEGHLRLEWAQVANVLNRALWEHTDRCSNCKEKKVWEAA